MLFHQFVSNPQINGGLSIGMIYVPSTCCDWQPHYLSAFLSKSRNSRVKPFVEGYREK